jgi:ADP-ribosylglycohydrolase
MGASDAIFEILPEAADSLRRRRLLPPAWTGTDPGLSWTDGLDYGDRFRGCLLAGAIGDALGRPAEGRSRKEVRRRFGQLTDFVPWRGWSGGPRGTITDDTQLTMCVAETLLAAGRFDPDDFARRLVAWLPSGRGKGATCVSAVEALIARVPWWDAGPASAGNGAAMRAAPVGLRYADDIDGLRVAAALSAAVTHADPMAVASAIAQALAVAWCLHQPAGKLDPVELVTVLGRVLDDVFDPGHPERRPGAGPQPVRLVDRIRILPGLLDATPDDAFDALYNGAFVLESLPAALWCFLASPEDPERVIVTAVSGGRDADTVAAMAGNLVGAYHGESALPARWTGDLEYAGDLRRLADGLLDAARGATGVPRTTSPQARPAPSLRERFTGCLLGGAVGDALGAPLEFLSRAEIDRRFGPGGISGYIPAYGRPGAITDDTQMTLFTAEGLVRACNRFADRGLCDVPGVLLRAYQRWLFTQEGREDAVPWDGTFSAGPSGWLVGQEFLRSRRAPGNTCLSALRTGRRGSIEERLNDSKGCGGVMRVAPVGLTTATDPFALACEAAALTHGHPSGFLAAGALALMISRLCRGDTLEAAVAAARAQLAGEPEAGEVAGALDAAIAAARQGPDPDVLAGLGEGWVAEEALAMSVYCALVAGDFRSGVHLAVHHGGDSDSTGAITGNLLGAARGVAAIPDDLLAGLEGRDVIERVALDLHDHCVGDGPRDWERYPPW